MVVAGRLLDDGDVAIMMVEAEATREVVEIIAGGGKMPTEAVVAEGSDRGVVFVLMDGKLERRAVRLGAVEPDGQVVQSGLLAGDKVVVGGLEKLKDEERVRVTTKPEPDDAE